MLDLDCGPYVKYEIHLHSTYRVPVLLFTLHNLPDGGGSLDLDAVYRYLVPDFLKANLRLLGVRGGISCDVSYHAGLLMSITKLTPFVVSSSYQHPFVLRPPLSDGRSYAVAQGHSRRLSHGLAGFRGNISWSEYAARNGAFCCLMSSVDLNAWHLKIRSPTSVTFCS